MVSREGTLGARADEVERAGFVGRTQELARVDAVLGGTDDRNVVFVHGPGGIGKTTFIREVVRRAALAGRQAAWATATELVADPDNAGRLVIMASALLRPVVVLDVWESAGAAATAVRDDVLPRLPADTTVVIGGRQPPELGWWIGWERLVLEIPLHPLTDVESLQLLVGHGVADHQRASAISKWAAGSPLALVLAAGSGEDWAPEVDAPPRQLVARLSRRLLQGVLDADRVGVLTTAATARITSRDVLAAALPGIDADEAYDWLEGQTFVEHRSGGVVLHALVGQVVLVEAVEAHADLLRDVRRRLADHLAARAVRNRTPVSPDLLHLINDPAVRWGFGWDETGTYRIDRSHPADGAVIDARLAETKAAGHLPWIRRYLSEAPGTVGVARDRTGTVCGMMISATPATASDLIAEDPILGRWMHHVRDTEDGGNAVLWRHAIDMTGDDRSPVQPLLGAAGIARSGLGNPRFCYLPISRGTVAAEQFAAAVGAVHEPSLDCEVDGDVTECHILDFGPGGIVGAHRAAVYADVGLPLPGDGTRTPPVEAVREALRSWDDVSRLAANPLAANPLAGSDGVADRADYVKHRILAAIDAAFGQSGGDLQLREVLAAGYLERQGGHEAAARRLNISRAVYFRRLRDATDRVAAALPEP